MTPPSAAAREAAHKIVTEYAWDSQTENKLARDLDAFAAARVEEERAALRSAMRDALLILDEPGTPPKSVWRAWYEKHAAAVEDRV